MSRLWLGAVADDFTGATDLANNLARAGMRVVLTAGTPSAEEVVNADAVVIALKTRTIDADEAVKQSMAAALFLLGHGARQLYFKICSTFDSTPRGNIGPVIEAFSAELGKPFSVVAPAFPTNGRTVVNGMLFVNGVPLAESSMRHHPLTPMTDSNLVRVLQPQMRSLHVGLIGHGVVSVSSEAITRRIDELEKDGVCVAIVDTETDDDLDRLAGAVHDAALITAGSGVAAYLPKYWGFTPTENATALPKAKGKIAMLAGSCSAATQGQVRHFLADGGVGFRVEVSQLVTDFERAVHLLVEETTHAWTAHPDAAVLIYSTADEATRSKTALSSEAAGELVERAFARLAVELVGRGVGRLIVAGGETSGVCVGALGVGQMTVGPQIDPGVPWCYAEHTTESEGGLHLALKSGNFGTEDFFAKAIQALDGQA